MKKSMLNQFNFLIIFIAFNILAVNPVSAQWVMEVDIDGSTELFPLATANFGELVSDTLTGPVKEGIDGSDRPFLGCDSLTNDLTAYFGILKHGDCSFKQKAINAQNAGAIALIVCNSINDLYPMPDDLDIEEELFIQTVMLTNSDCRIIRQAVQDGSDVSISLYENSPNVIWGGPDEPNSTFDGGLNDWTAVGIKCSNDNNNQPVDDANATWEWVANPISKGAYWASRGPLISPTASNGAVIFDSDFLDNNGNEGEFLTGTCPEPQIAQLISPIIDLSGTPSVALTFYQYYRAFRGSNGYQNETATFVEVSVDGWQSWTRFPVNEEIEVNNSTSNPSHVKVDISEIAGGQSEVQVRFVWDGSYYFWMIDDVQIIELPEVNLQINSADFPLTAVCIPVQYPKDQVMDFEVSIGNIGASDQDLVETIVEIINTTTDEIFFSDTHIISNLAQGTDTILSFENSFTPECFPMGDYSISYRVNTPGKIDYNVETNFIAYYFRITDGVYSTEDCSQVSDFIGLRATGSSIWYWGNAYFIGEMYKPDDTPRILEIQTALSLGRYTQWPNQNVFLHIFKFIDSGKNAFDNFDLTTNLPPENHPDLTLIATASIDQDKFNQAGNGNLFGLMYSDFTLPDGSLVNEPLEIEPNHYYFIFLEIDNSSHPYVYVCRNTGNYLEGPSRELVFSGNSYYRFSPKYRRPVIRLNLDVLNNPDDSLLVCKENVVIELDEQGNRTLEPEDMVESIQVNCEIAALEATKVDFDCNNIGDNSIVVTLSTLLGEEASCTTTVSVEDNNILVARCLDLTFPIADSDLTFYVNPESIDNGSFIACGELSFDFAEGVPGFNCDDEGVYTLTLVVSDDLGNSDSCLSEITILCVEGLMPVSGFIEREFGEPVVGVEMTWNGSPGGTSLSQGLGLYQIFVEENSNAVITPFKDGNPIQFITTADLIALQRHILQIEPFGSPYRIIAGDASGDNNVSTYDLVILQSLIIGLLPDFPAPVWRFIPESYEFSNPYDPYAESFPEVKGYQAIENPLVDENWVAIKTGDVAWNSAYRIDADPLEFMVSVTDNDAGHQFLVFKAANAMKIFGYQLALDFSEDITTSEFIPGKNMEGMDELNFYNHGGFARTNYYNGEGINLDAGSELFRIRINSDIQIENDRSVVKINNQDGMLAEGYLVSGDVRPVSILSVAKPNSSWTFEQLSPVPSLDYLNLELNVFENTDFTIEAFNLNGQLVISKNYHADMGINTITLDCRGLPAGSYFIRIVSSDMIKTMPFILIN